MKGALAPKATKMNIQNTSRDALLEPHFSREKVRKIVRIFKELEEVFNQNSSSPSWNNITEAFDNLVLSPGAVAIDIFATTIGKSSSLYETIGDAVERAISRHQYKQRRMANALNKEKREAFEEAFQEDMEVALERIVGQLDYLNMQLNCDDDEKDIEEQGQLSQHSLFADEEKKNSIPFEDFSAISLHQDILDDPLLKEFYAYGQNEPLDSITDTEMIYSELEEELNAADSYFKKHHIDK